jgi:hypothetical protein
MTVKKEYAVGDTVWIYGINRSNAKPTAGKVIKVVDLSNAGWSEGDHYVIEIPTHIESLLEIRSWHNISQDSRGPVGSLRGLNIESTIKHAATLGFITDDNPLLDSDVEEDGPSADQIHAALQKSQMDMEHAPLDLKASAAKPKRRYFKKKKA